MRRFELVGVAKRVLAILAAVAVVNAPAFGSQVNFETLATGQTFGGGAQVPGGFLFAQEGIQVTGETFRTGTFEDFNLATIRAPGTDSFASKHVFFDNINFGFDLTGVAPVSDVTIEYHEFGGVNNFSVNGGLILELSSMTSMPANVAPGVTASVDADSIHLSGPVSSFLIGGQELAVDNIVAVPEPTCLALLAAGLGAGYIRRRR